MKTVKPIYIEKDSDIGILLLHGFTSNPNQFKELSQYLANSNYTVYAPVIAGHGSTPYDLVTTSSDDWKNSAITAYNELRAKVKKVVIIGNSFGSNLAFSVAKETDNSPSGIIALGAPITLRYQKFIKFRLATYGRFRRFYRKPKRLYKIDYTDMSDTDSYDVIPLKNFHEFLSFIKNETMANIASIKTPVLIANASVDPVVHPKSSKFIYDNIGSERKEVYIFESNRHGVAEEKPCPGLFAKIIDFIKEIENE